MTYPGWRSSSTATSPGWRCSSNLRPPWSPGTLRLPRPRSTPRSSHSCTPPSIIVLEYFLPSTFVPEYLTSVNPCRAAPAHPCHPLDTLLFELLREGGDLDAALGLARHVLIWLIWNFNMMCDLMFSLIVYSSFDLCFAFSKIRSDLISNLILYFIYYKIF